jgi:uncharacterized protein YjiS (DUF1127 family)
MLTILILRSVSGGLRHLASRLSALELALRERRQRAIAQREFHRLDDRALKDLGICRSEFDSCWAESREQEQTRLRLVLRPRSEGWS